MADIPAKKDNMYQFYPFNYEGLLLADEGHAVIKGKNPMPGFSGHCGYCVFTKDEIPVEWHGEYSGVDADAHGGLTYASIEGGDEEARTAALKALWAERDARYKAREEAGEPFESLWGEYYERSKKLAREFPYTHVVFGFDTAHYRDDWNPELHQPDYVMHLTKVMRTSIATAARLKKAEAA